MKLPGYIHLHETGVLEKRIKKGLELLKKCEICPRKCGVDRNKSFGFCGIGRNAVVSSYFPHYGEESCITGYNGSGTIFFTGCNLKCVFCQNFDISHNPANGFEVNKYTLAEIMIELQERNCHNINLVTPSHVIVQILEALPIAIEMGLKLPLVYNTSSYDNIEILKLLNGIIDIYMPDFKFFNPKYSSKYCNAPDYPLNAKNAIKEMYRQVGNLVIKNGIAIKGVLIRHLVMPGLSEDSKKILSWLRKNLGSDIFVNIMNQYHPAGMVLSNKRYEEINRGLNINEFLDVIQYAKKIGLKRIYT